MHKDQCVHVVSYKKAWPEPNIPILTDPSTLRAVPEHRSYILPAFIHDNVVPGSTRWQWFLGPHSGSTGHCIDHEYTLSIVISTFLLKIGGLDLHALWRGCSPTRTAPLNREDLPRKNQPHVDFAARATCQGRPGPGRVKNKSLLKTSLVYLTTTLVHSRQELVLNLQSTQFWDVYK